MPMAVTVFALPKNTKQCGLFRVLFMMQNLHMKACCVYYQYGKGILKENELAGKTHYSIVYWYRFLPA